MSVLRSVGLRFVWVGFLGVLSLAGCGGRPAYHIDVKYGVGDPEFIETMGNLLGPPLLEGNETTTLVNGERIFPPMLEAIQSVMS